MPCSQGVRTNASALRQFNREQSEWSSQLEECYGKRDGEVVNNPQRLPGSRQEVSCGSRKAFVLTHHATIIYIYLHPNLPTFPLMR